MRRFAAAAGEDDRDDGRSAAHSRSSAAEYVYHFMSVNERPVEDMTLDFFYRPHTVTLLACGTVFLVYTAFTHDDSSPEHNAWLGLKCVFLFFMAISLLAFPNGPFTRPHPAVWRLLFGMSVFYLMFLAFVVFQTFGDIKAALKWLDPLRLAQWELDEKEYAINCSDVSPERIWDHMDVFAFGHFFGWAMKALLIRHTVLLWYISITWELTELAFMHLLPNFAECWWDAVLLDVLLCNGLGIAVGMWVCHKLEIRNYHWESVKHIRSMGGKLRRVVMQFTPHDWTQFQWFRPHSSYWRCAAVALFVIIWQLTELNTFFLKHIFAIDTAHPIVWGRILLIAGTAMPAIRQYYYYVTDPHSPRLGSQCWVYAAIVFTESIICIKFGLKMFAKAQAVNIAAWIALLIAGSFVCVYLATLRARNAHYTREVRVRATGGGRRRNVEHTYLDSSVENVAQRAGGDGDGDDDGDDDKFGRVHRRRRRTHPAVDTSGSSARSSSDSR